MATYNIYLTLPLMHNEEPCRAATPLHNLLSCFILVLRLELSNVEPLLNWELLIVFQVNEKYPLAEFVLLPVAGITAARVVVISSEHSIQKPIACNQTAISH